MLGEDLVGKIYLSPSVALAAVNSKEGVTVVVNSFSLSSILCLVPAPRLYNFFHAQLN